MAQTDDFSEFIARIRDGDGEAAAELVRRFAPLVRREVRFRMEDRRLQRGFDSEDVCQSVLASFFVRTAAGQFEFDCPERLAGLLVQITRNKLAASARAQTRQKRDHRRVSGGPEDLNQIEMAAPSPSGIAINRELLERFHTLLDTEERQLVNFRTEGLSWVQITQEMGGTADSRRVQYNRAVKRAVKALGLDDDDVE
ncbi:MAG: DNA-directed polymerase specialized sigma subunit, sigma24 [Planctomycetaceae bacterium]|nr:DNA-directed polymerase specialized sigma subunit, sigma24 [Planctomycetaceae bacterium]